MAIKLIYPVYKMDEMMKRGGKARKTIKQKQKQSVVIKNVINIGERKKRMNKRQKRARTQPQQQQAQPSIPQGQYPLQRLFQPPQQIYRSVSMSSANASEASNNTSKVVDATEKISQGKVVAEINNVLDKKPYERLLDIPSNSIKNAEPSPPSFDSLFPLEYKTQEEKDKIERIRIDYEMNLTAKNQKRREASARKKISQLEQLGGKIKDVEQQQKELLSQGQLLIEKMTPIQKKSVEDIINEQKDKQQTAEDYYENQKQNEPTSKKEKKPNMKKIRKEIEVEEKKLSESMKKFMDRKNEKDDTQKVFEDFLSQYTEDELEKLGIKK